METVTKCLTCRLETTGRTSPDAIAGGMAACYSAGHHVTVSRAVSWGVITLLAKAAWRMMPLDRQAMAAQQGYPKSLDLGRPSAG